MTPLLPSTGAPVRDHRNAVRNQSESLAAFNRNSWPLSSESAIWDELFPAEQARIVQLLVERVDVHEDGIDISLRIDGLVSLVEEFSGVREAA